MRLVPGTPGAALISLSLFGGLPNRHQGVTGAGGKAFFGGKRGQFLRGFPVVAKNRFEDLFFKTTKRSPVFHFNTIMPGVPVPRLNSGDLAAATFNYLVRLSKNQQEAPPGADRRRFSPSTSRANAEAETLRRFMSPAEGAKERSSRWSTVVRTGKTRRAWASTAWGEGWELWETAPSTFFTPSNRGF